VNPFGVAGWRITLWAAIVLAALSFLYLVRGILLPFVLAFIIAILLDPSIRRLRMRGFSRGSAVGVIVALFFVFATLLIVWLTPLVGNQMGMLQTTVERVSSSIAAPDPNRNYFIRWNPVVAVEIPQREDPLDRVLKDFSGPLSAVGVPTTRKALYDRYIAPNSKQISGAVQNFFNGLFGILGNLASQLLMLALVPILVIFMLNDFDSMKRRGLSWIPPSIRASTVDLLSDIGNVFVNYLRGVTISVLIYMTSSAIILTLLGAPYSVLLGVLFGALYLIPFVGSIISLTVLVLACGLSGTERVLFIDVGSPWIYALICATVQFLFDRVYDSFIYPKVVGKAVGLSPLVGIFVAFAGGALFGIPGMLLAFPVAGAVKIVLDRLMRVTSSTADSLALPAIPLRHRA
jgi:predicted PurR-regulated permease PerM